MEFKPNAILDSMDRAQALACVNRRYGADDNDNNFFVCGGQVWLWVNELFPEYASSKSNFIPAINAYYDAKDAASKPKWVEPEVILTFHDKHFNDMYYYAGCRANTKIACENARRKIEAFIAANGGSGRWPICATRGKFVTYDYGAFGCPDIGSITCATRELAEALIERYPDELRLLLG